MRLGVGHVPEGRGTFTNLSVDENLRVAAYTRRDKAAIERDRDMVYEYFPILKARLAQQAGTLSGGEQQMLAISRALMLAPRLMLLDEPSFGLAPLIVQEIFRIMRRINGEAKVSMLLVEQNAALALELADHAYVLETGRVVMSGKAVRREERRGHPQILSRLLKGTRPAMEQLIQQVASGLANGAIYACLALALVMIFVSTDHINFAQGEMAMFSAYLVWQALEWGVNFWVALPVVVLLSFLLGVAIERVILRPLHHAPDPVRGGGVHRPARDLPLAGGRHLGPHHQGHRLAVPESRLRRLRLHRPASDRHDRGDGAAAGGAVRLLPLHAAGACHAAAAQNPASARLAGIRVDWMLALGLGAGGRHRRGGRRAGRARRLPRAQHDGVDPALRLCRRAGRRHLEPGRRGGRRLHRRRAGEPDRLLRQPAGEDLGHLYHRQRREADAWR